METSFNIEASREESESTPFHICSKRGLNKNFVYSDHFELPLHLRYHAATGKGFVLFFESFPWTIMYIMAVSCRSLFFDSPH